MRRYTVTMTVTVIVDADSIESAIRQGYNSMIPHAVTVQTVQQKRPDDSWTTVWDNGMPKTMALNDK